MKEAIMGVLGGFVTVAIVALIVSNKSKTVELVKAGFGGFADTMAVSMGGNTKL